MSSASRAAALVEILRPMNGLIAAVAVLVGALVSRSPVFWGTALAGAASAFAASGASNALNDRLDVVPDAVNRPGRPIPSGRSTKGAATATACLFGAASVALASLVGPMAVALALAWLVLTALYSLVLKGVALMGNVTVALVASTPFLMGGFSQGNYLPALIPCALAFLIHLAREIVKDIEDVEGDEAAGVRTFAVRRGAAASFLVARAVMMTVIVLAALPFVYGLYGWGYAGLIAVIDVALVWLMLTMEANSMSSGLRRPSNALKAVMVVGLLAFVVGVL